ncbi:uncharacterized protein [Aegilops tauschii subsp. strangulata]|uniref:uncharacterized protein isoform X1 n=1 Tax=Aegilops tauschii subsp. strangulata TaxID=200361 RepID=UPI00098B1AFD|nr:uncharacterized protein LOC109752766 isoform X1 [Aegilops tauschii subsp. strangulata]
MAASAVSPEEPELAVLLEVSTKVRDADKVYEYMHKLRRAVGCVIEETAKVLEGRFQSEKAQLLVSPSGMCVRLRAPLWRTAVGAISWGGFEPDHGWCSGLSDKFFSASYILYRIQVPRSSKHSMCWTMSPPLNSPEDIRHPNVLHLRSRTHLSADTCPHASCFKYLLSWGNSLGLVPAPGRISARQLGVEAHVLDGFYMNFVLYIS